MTVNYPWQYRSSIFGVIAAAALSVRSLVMHQPPPVMVMIAFLVALAAASATYPRKAKA